MTVRRAGWNTPHGFSKYFVINQLGLVRPIAALGG